MEQRRCGTRGDECSNRRHIYFHEDQVETLGFRAHSNLLVNDKCNRSCHGELRADRRDVVGMTFEIITETSESGSGATIHDASL